MRIVLVVVALIVVWTLVLGTAAGVPWSAPWSAAHRRVLAGNEFRPVIGAGVEDGAALGVGANAADGSALQSVAIEPFDAADLPLLGYRFDDFPRTLELVLVFRRADAPDDVQTVALPWPGGGDGVIDLREASPAWRGTIIEFGFAEYAATQLVPPSIAFKPFRLLQAQLSSPSWREVPRLLGRAWFGYQPWRLSSVNVVGAESMRPSLPGTLVAGALASLLVCAWLLRWPAPRLWRNAAICAGIAWVVLDARWLADLGGKHQLTRSIYAAKSWSERARLQPDEDLAGFAQLTRQQLAGATPARVLVASDSVYTVLRLIWFLLPLNAAPLDAAAGAVAPQDWPAGTIVVVCASKAWQFDESAASLRSGSQAIPVTPLYFGGSLGIYRVRGAAG
jgi:hypothetical protein